ncbi:hypothetical protein D623_10014566 [Myotis brandtii]|uniref:Uncharacterized protein n=1 Tax=Myotis brandtii TaxID=109478 RepID=S7P289_MYOBR|nr:hypothetical protein D623_10014566 [Myotis brandtii]
MELTLQTQRRPETNGNQHFIDSPHPSKSTPADSLCCRHRRQGCDQHSPSACCMAHRRGWLLGPGEQLAMKIPEV